VSLIYAKSLACLLPESGFSTEITRDDVGCAAAV
jgi:hypothetical protein